MGKKESNIFGTPYKLLMPQDGAPNKPLPPHWTPSIQANGTPLQANPMGLSNNPIVARDAALVFSEKPRTFGENNLDSMKKCDGNSQPVSLIFKLSRKNGDNRSSIPKINKDGVSLSSTSRSKEPPGEGHDTNTDFPSTKKQLCNVMLENANSTEQNQNLETCLNATGSNTQFSKLEENEIRKERKRQSNRESANRSRMRKQNECEELHRNMNILKVENSELTHMLKRLSEECLELSTENDSIQEELLEMYGPESIEDLLPMKPASGGSQTTAKEES